MSLTLHLVSEKKILPTLISWLNAFVHTNIILTPEGNINDCGIALFHHHIISLKIVETNVFFHTGDSSVFRRLDHTELKFIVATFFQATFE